VRDVMPPAIRMAAASSVRWTLNASRFISNSHSGRLSAATESSTLGATVRRKSGIDKSGRRHKTFNLISAKGSADARWIRGKKCLTAAQQSINLSAFVDLRSTTHREWLRDLAL
jgi:hypothetical protein